VALQPPVELPPFNRILFVKYIMILMVNIGNGQLQREINGFVRVITTMRMLAEIDGKELHASMSRL
jgi:hypothetical protein